METEVRFWVSEQSSSVFKKRLYAGYFYTNPDTNTDAFIKDMRNFLRSQFPGCDIEVTLKGEMVIGEDDLVPGSNKGKITDGKL